MLLMFGLGIKNLLSILALTILVFIEKELPGGTRLRIVV